MAKSAIALLLFLEPLHFASEALAVLPTIVYRGVTAVVELVVHGAVAAVCAAAGLSLWNESPDAARIATVAIVAAVGRTIQSLYWSALPNDTRPGDEPFMAAIAIGVGVIALLLVRRPRRDRAEP
jgi:hypothetical protein